MFLGRHVSFDIAFHVQNLKNAGIILEKSESVGILERIYE